MYICKHCGSPLPPGAFFCSVCGAVTDDKIWNPGDEMSGERTGSPGKLMQSLKVVLYVVLFFVIQLLVALGFTLSYILPRIRLAGNSESLAILEQLASIFVQKNMVTITLISNLLFVAAVVIIALLRRRSLGDSLGMRPFPARLTPLFIMFGASANVMLSLLVNLIPWPRELLELQGSSYSYISASPLLITVLSVSLATGLAEEILFRGIVITRLRGAFGGTFALAASSVIFSVCHGQPVAMTYSFILAVFLGIFFTKYDSVWPTVICHASFNLMSIAVSYITDPLLTLAVISASAASLIISLYILMRKNGEHSRADLNSNEIQEEIIQ